MMIECKCDICNKKMEDGMEKGKLDIFIAGYLVEMRNSETRDLCFECIIRGLKEELKKSNKALEPTTKRYGGSV